MTQWQPASPDPSTQSQLKLTLRKAEAAIALGVSERTLHKLLKTEQIGSFKLDRAVLIPVAELEAFIARKGGLS
ncbi:MAG: helix-turn-helix domain-containing protein [Phycisphaerales bacterium]|nr:helix-turn-helix domain-containing protein [Phycisphaerales bacterium]